MNAETREQINVLESLPNVRRVNDYVSVGYHRETVLFAVRYFNEDNEELAYYCPPVMPEASLVVFEPPRRWSEHLLRHIGVIE